MKITPVEIVHIQCETKTTEARDRAVEVLNNHVPDHVLIQNLQNNIQALLKESLSLETKLVWAILAAMIVGALALVEFILLLRYWI